MVERPDERAHRERERLHACMLLKVALEIVLPTGGENLNSFSRSDGSALRSALDELSVGGHRADEAM